MTLNFLTSSDSFIWARRGFLKVSELSKGDEILGLNGGGNPSYQEILSVQRTDEERVIRAASHRNESYVFEKQRVIKLGGASQIRFLKEGEDKLELCLKPAFFYGVKSLLENKPNGLSSSFAYLLGRTKNVRFEGDFKHRLTFLFNDWSKLRQLAHILHQTLLEHNIDPRRKIYQGYSKSLRFQYELMIKSPQFIYLLNNIDPDPNHVPIEIRLSSLNCIKSYLTGLIEAFSTCHRKSFRISIKRPQNELRRFLYDTFPLFGATPRKTRWSYQVSIEIDENVLEKIKEGNISSKVRRFYLLKKLDKFRFKSIWGFKTTGIHWSPAIDLLLLES